MARDYRAEYAARVARAAAKGVTGQARYGKAGREIAARARASTMGRAPREREIRIGRQRVREVNTSDRRYLANVLKGAAARGQHAVIYTRWQLDNGKHATAIMGGDKPSTRPEAEPIGGPVGKITVLLGTPGAIGGAGGIPARQIVADMSNYDDIDDYFVDWWDGLELYA